MSFSEFAALYNKIRENLMNLRILVAVTLDINHTRITSASKMNQLTYFFYNVQRLEALGS